MTVSRIARRAASPALQARRREALARSLAGRFWLRFHASLIVAGTFAAGMLANAVMLRLGLDAVLARWLLAIVVGYVAFFVLVRFWLAYVGARRWDAPGDLPDVGSGGDGAALPRWSGGGGRFGGGGASGGFEAPGVLPVASGGSPASSGSGGAAGALLDGFDVDDGLPIVLGLVVLALVAVLLGSAVVFVWTAPELLTDTAFAAMLSGGALPGLARAQSPDWHGTLLRATWKPLAAVTVVAVAAALALMHWFPGAATLGHAFRQL